MSTTLMVAEYGAPPETEVPSVQERVQLTSAGKLPAVTVTQFVLPCTHEPGGDEGGEADAGQKLEDVVSTQEPDEGQVTPG